MSPMLELSRVAKTFMPNTANAMRALDGIDLALTEGEFVTVIGSNGAGKSTLLAVVSGLVKALAGRIRFDELDITNGASDRIVEAGLVHVPQGRRLFAGLTVRENLLMGAYRRSDRQQVLTDLDWVLGLFPSLEHRLALPAGKMSGGEQQMCAIGRALMARPTLLMLDEPSMGLAPIFVEKIFEIIHEINEQGTTILLVEQNALMALDAAQRGYVMETGRIALTDDAKALRENEQVQKAYLGIE